MARENLVSFGGSGRGSEMGGESLTASHGYVCLVGESVQSSEMVKSLHGVFWIIVASQLGDRKGTTKKLCDKEFVERPGELSGVICLKSEGPKGGRRKGGRGRKLSHFSFCCAFRCCVVYSPCFPVWVEEKVMTIYDAGPLAAGPLCGLLIKTLLWLGNDR